MELSVKSTDVNIYSNKTSITERTFFDDSAVRELEKFLFGRFQPKQERQERVLNLHHIAFVSVEKVSVVSADCLLFHFDHTKK